MILKCLDCGKRYRQRLGDTGMQPLGKQPCPECRSSNTAAVVGAYLGKRARGEPLPEKPERPPLPLPPRPARKPSTGPRRPGRSGR